MAKAENLLSSFKLGLVVVKHTHFWLFTTWYILTVYQPEI